MSKTETQGPSKLGKLEFDLDDPTTAREMNLALNAANIGIIITELDNRLRSMLKYEDKENISIEEIRKIIHELIEEYYPGFYNDFR